MTCTGYYHKQFVVVPTGCDGQLFVGVAAEIERVSFLAVQYHHGIFNFTGTTHQREIYPGNRGCGIAPAIGVERAGMNVSAADELLKLKQLKDSGVLSDAEFEIQKQKILSWNVASHTQSTETQQQIGTTAPDNEPLVYIEGEKGGLNIGMILFAIIIAVFLLIMFASM